MKTINSWLFMPQPNSQAKFRLFCFPYAGANAFNFRSWAKYLPKDIEFCIIQLPGRANRSKEPLLKDIRSLVQTLAPALVSHLDLPFAFFGHSMGALMAFELTRQLRRLQAPLPIHLFISGRRAPQMPSFQPHVHSLPTPLFLEKIRRYSGTPEVILQNQELMDLLLPVLRADLQINETYTYKNDFLLDCPISAFGGLQDPEVSVEEMTAWSHLTSNTFNLRMYDGHHFFIQEHTCELLKIVSQDLMSTVYASESIAA